MARFVAVISLLAGSAVAAEPTATFRNPIQSGFYPDPSICRVGDDYYLVHSSFEYFPGVPIFHSRDLVHWRQIGHCLSRPSQLSLENVGASGGIFAPTLRHHDGTFYLVTTNIGRSNFYCTATDPAGPWSEPHPLDPDGMDPSLLFDDDGKVYYTRHSGGEHGCAATQELDLATGRLVGELREVWRGTGDVWPEGPHLYKIDGRYYLMIAEGGTSYDHMVTVARSDSPWGPFEPCPRNPILTHRDRPESPIQALGHADLVETPAGWWAVCLGIRPQRGRYHHLGRETFLAPVAWDADGWPTMGVGGRLDVVMAAPRLVAHPWPAAPSRDEFDADQLDFAWNFLRNPRDRDWSLTERPGFLRLNGSAVSLNERDSPAFVGRRQTALSCTVEAKLSFDPQHENEEAGLVIRGNDANHVDFGVTLKDGRRRLFLRKVFAGKTVEPIQYADAPTGDVIVVVAATPESYRFVAKDGETDEDLFAASGVVETSKLASETIGGFTGVYFGMYATGNGQASTVPADFDWFDLKILER